MITSDKFQEILTNSENTTVDFKAEPHKLDNDYFVSEFIKDILAMSNTPRENTAYIVIGVKFHSDSGIKDLLGVNAGHPDDSDLQDKMNLARVEPKPKFTYQVVTYDNKSFGVIEIPIDKNGPFIATRDLNVVKAHRVYFRRGTKNDEAKQMETKEIYKWFQPNNLTSSSDENSNTNKQTNPSWDTFYKACHNFDTNRLYTFILGDNIQGSSSWSAFGRLPISLVLDFNKLTENQGAYFHSISALRSNRSSHLLTFDDKQSLAPEFACYWYAAKGLEGRSNSTVEGDWRAWNRKYGTHIQSLISSLAKASGGKPITVISLWYAPEYIRELCSIFDRYFGDSVDFVFAIPDAKRLDNLSEQFAGKSISIDISNILMGIAKNFRDINQELLLSAGIPRSDNSFYIIEPQDLRWLSEDLDVIHSNIELESQSEQRETGRDFLRGAVVDWKDLNLHYDADRDITDKVKRLIERELKSRTTSRLNLYHWPGAGGTTVARRVAWDLRRIYPVVLLKRVTVGDTISRLRKLFSETGQPILTLIEGADAISDRLEQLFNEARSEQIPVVFLSILRRFDLPKESERTIFLGQNLNLLESSRFVEAYKRVAPNKEKVLTTILDKDTPKERTPFHFALAAFERDYLGITKYVEARIKAASPIQKEILTYIALAYFYGHKPTLPQIFAGHLGRPANNVLQLDKILDDPQLELLIKESNQKWRPAHQLIAEEILKIVLSDSPDERRNWKRGLSTWSVNFIKVLSKGILFPNDDLLDLMRRVFILRDEHDLLGTESAALPRFSAIIDDIQNMEGKLTVFKELVDAFPDEAHFWGHLGRFYSFGMEEPREAIIALDRAILLSPNDPVLFHMKGMCYRSLVYSQIKNAPYGEIKQDMLTELKENVELALESFQNARNLDQYTEHPYISPVQLLLRVIDFGFKISGYKLRSEFLVSASSSWYREKLDEIETLMDKVRSVREGEKPSGYIISCQAGLDQLYDDYSRALEGWQELLTRRDVFAPPIRRQIVRAYLGRKQRQWTLLAPREIERIVDLMEDNMKEEPSSDSNIRIWFNAFRLSSRQNIDIALDRLATWKSKGDSLESYYYLYILHVMKAMDGSMIERERSLDLIEQCRAKARNAKNRTRSFEWFGEGDGIERLIHHTELGEWDDQTNFYNQVQRLDRIEGRVAQIKGPESGHIELTSCGLKAFFVPAVAEVFKGRDENQRVEFYLGFSYDGLRAWSVKKLK